MPAKTKSKRERRNWLALVGVTISGAGLLWAVFSHFIPNSEPSPNQPINPRGMIVATANGAGGVAIMNGGQVINTVITPKEGTAGRVSPRP
jgi:hypothetical protein